MTTYTTKLFLAGSDLKIVIEVLYIRQCDEYYITFIYTLVCPLHSLTYKTLTTAFTSKPGKDSSVGMTSVSYHVLLLSNQSCAAFVGEDARSLQDVVRLCFQQIHVYRYIFSVRKFIVFSLLISITIRPF